MVPEPTSRRPPSVPAERPVAGTLERVGTYLLVVLVGLLVAEAVLDVDPPIDLAALAAVAGGLLLVGRLAGPNATWAPAAATGLTGRQATAVVAGLCVAGAALRLHALGEPSLWFDEAITTNAAIGLLERGRPGFPSGATYWRGLPHTALVAASLAVFGVTEWAARLPAVVAGVATIPVTYWLGREVGSRRVGLVAAVLVTVLTWEIAWSRQARMYALLQLGYAAALVGLARVDRTGLRDRVTLVALVGGTALAALTHRIGLVLFPVAAGYLALLGVADRDRLDRRSWALAAGAVLLAAAALELVGTGPLAAARLVLGTEIDHADRYHVLLGSTLDGVYPLAIVGLGLSARRWRHGLLLALAVGPPAWVLAFHTWPFALRYLYFAVPVLAVAVGLVVEHGVEQGRALVGWAGERFAGSHASFPRADGMFPTAVTGTALPVIVVALVVAPGLAVAPQEHYRLGPNAPQPDFAAAYAAVDDHARPGDVLVAGWTAPALFYHGTVDYWLAHDLTGARSDWTTDDGREVYSGAVPVRNATALRTVVDCHPRGWVVIDGIVFRKLDDETLAVVADLTPHDVGAAGMHVYSWAGSAECPDDAASPSVEPADPRVAASADTSPLP